MPDIRHEVLIQAEPAIVFEALTTTKGLSSWWTPAATAPVEGHSIARFPFGENYHKEMEIIEQLAPQRLHWHCISGAREWIGTQLLFELLPATHQQIADDFPEITGQLQQFDHFRTGTLLRFHHFEWKDYTPMFAECNYTWGRFLWSLKCYCETGTGFPWPGQHRPGR